MRKWIWFFVLWIGSGVVVPSLWAQEASDPDLALKNTLYAQYRKEVLAYDKKKYDDLFFSFFEKQNDPQLILTKEEYYTYTIKIAIYSEKLGMLYKDQKEAAAQTKKEWFDKRYEAYLQSKK
ncbi:hypothetical protein [Flavobacterium sp.]|jgi:hypothetical protein|uniref:hypothetical protein n=1 Tax=Flavobacterium sp. TaxID=239 RepID=UPI0022C5B288|nr:hypothetical protein [Flavobacterium sp.]MCZ8145131.1 hypothetical protein [Flavobacterium sp.]MCZ8368149.1 hypothetical protein [Flavobacterium sp.]